MTWEGQVKRWRQQRADREAWMKAVRETLAYIRAPVAPDYARMLELYERDFFPMEAVYTLAEED